MVNVLITEMRPVSSKKETHVDCNVFESTLSYWILSGGDTDRGHWGNIEISNMLASNDLNNNNNNNEFVYSAVSPSSS